MTTNDKTLAMALIRGMHQMHQPLSIRCNTSRDTQKSDAFATPDGRKSKRGSRDNVCPDWRSTYSRPNGNGSWLHIYQDKSSWTHLLASEDPEVVARAIHAHFSATKKSG
jgi:hypothetical protein